MRQNYRSRYLVTVDNEQSIVSFIEYENCKFEENFLVLKSNKKFTGKRPTCRMTEMTGACDSSDFDSNTSLVGDDLVGEIK